MFSVVRSSVAGQLIRWISGKRLLRYPEERPDFQLPERYKLHKDHTTDEIEHPHTTHTDGGVNAFNHEIIAPGGNPHGRAPSEDSEATLAVQDNFTMRQGAAGIGPEGLRKMQQDPTIVTWYGVDDPENPANW